MNKKVILLILDGWGIGQNLNASAVDKASTPFIDSLYNNYPHATLEASALAVGLPVGQMGNSEVGHMNIGAGRVVYQDLVKINLAVQNKTINQDKTLLDAIQYAKTNNKKIHLIGLVSDGGVHSHIEHVKGLCSMLAENHMADFFIHAFLDGRDTDPKSGLGFIRDLQNHLLKTGGKIATVIGRYFAMDRDNRWERVKLAYDLMVRGLGIPTHDFEKAISDSYEEGTTDEFIQPLISASELENHSCLIAPGDVVISFNFRTDRGREITMALTQKEFPDYNMHPLDLYYITLTNYDDTFKGVKVVFDKDNLQNTLGEVLEKAGKTQIRIAETEKYPHVTFFFSGGRENPFIGETRLLCASPKVATYDLQPEMSALCIRDKIIAELQKKSADFICLNFANPDMVGHTGNFEAAIKACEVVDQCAEAVVKSALSNDYTSIIIADHGNAEKMINEDGTPNTAHTTNLVPFIVVDNSFQGSLKDGKLGDLAPTILKLIGITPPAEMTGNVLI